MQKQVRYLFLGMDGGGYRPATAETTWARRFGDCKAKTALLLALLQALDIEARPVLVQTGPSDGLETRLPRMGAFNHVLVEARLGGKPIWPLSPTWNSAARSWSTSSISTRARGCPGLPGPARASGPKATPASAFASRSAS